MKRDFPVFWGTADDDFGGALSLFYHIKPGSSAHTDSMGSGSVVLTLISGRLACLGEVVLHTLNKLFSALGTFPHQFSSMSDTTLAANPLGSLACIYPTCTDGGGILTVPHHSSFSAILPPKRFDAATLLVVFLLFHVIPISINTQILQCTPNSTFYRSILKLESTLDDEPVVLKPNKPPPRPPPRPYTSSAHLR
ncbi:hypothetical protein GQ44DRAFT_354069 [Phaeosphaeriaceae sp. PMI808]|nr:hypothetical protein GQ44DRAFT_354069 [Phaeosphaeriaceae sp. PMI808]